MEKKRILVTGGAGFIGTNLVDYYIEKQQRVLTIDIAMPPVPSVKNCWKQVDLFDKEALRAAVHDFKPTHVVHLAARTDLAGKTDGDYAVNTDGTLNLVTALAGLSSLEKIVFASSMLVCKPGYIPVHDLDFAPTTVYGESKKNMELLIRGQQIAAEWIIVRPSSIWGPWFKTPYRDFFDRVIAGNMYNIKERACTKTYGFVLNTVYQIDKLLNKDGINGQLFYLGDRPPLNITAWANHICNKLNRRHPPAIPYPVFAVAAKLGDVLTKTGLPFPMTSFRLQNMTTDNILPLENLYNITGPGPYTEEEGISITLDWINNHK
jgi:nucleoside-diphosphate-sugar epimerase